ncbi:MAG TPA: FecR domain-containing protein [Steroidobacteraceae bacterium]|jgi:transmembrane sensor
MRNAEDPELKASQWLIRSESAHFTPDQEQELEAWLKQDLRHYIIYLRLRSTWTRASRLKELKPWRGDPDPELLDDPQLLGPLMAGRLPEQPEIRPPRPLILVVASAVLTIGLVVASVYIAEAARWQHFETSVGGNLHFPLPDGSSVQLSSDSELYTRLTGSTREFELARGEALVQVARDERRPFRLRAGNALVVSVGAEFDVRTAAPYSNDYTELLVNSGQVLAERSDWLDKMGWHHATEGASVVQAGYCAYMSPQAIHVSWTPPGAAARRMTWTRGLLSFSGETLGEAVMAFNRYNLRKMVIADRSLLTREIGGVFEATDPDSFVAGLKVVLGVEATTVGGAEGPGYGVVRLSPAK